jgi:hypothetical protein
MSESENKIKKVLKAFSQRPIAYQKIYAQITSSVTAGLLLSQIVYWWYGPAEEKEFYKTDRELTDELALGMKELKNAKAKLKKLKIISMIRKGVPCKTFYKLNETALLAQISSCAERAELVRPKGPNWLGRKGPTTTKTNTIDCAEKTKPKEISIQERLDLDLLIAREKKFLIQQLTSLLHPNKREATTFARIVSHLVYECQAGRLPVSVFKDAVEWARQAKASTASNKKGLFVAKVKQETGFKAQKQILKKI